jgi:hypothetical protein
LKKRRAEEEEQEGQSRDAAGNGKLIAHDKEVSDRPSSYLGTVIC